MVSKQYSTAPKRLESKSMEIRIEKLFLTAILPPLVCFILILFFCKPLSYANETAAEIAASGIVFKEEKNISIEKEDLYISQDKVEVAYVFKNHSSDDIKTIVAFPVPDYEYDLTATGEQAGWRDFHDFTVEVNGKKTAYLLEVRALLNGKDYSQLINAMGISIKDYGEGDRLKNDTFHGLFNKLSEEDKIILINHGLIFFDNGVAFPTWKVSLKYYWEQNFPANSSISIRHKYKPNNGYDVFSDKYYKDACITKEVTQWVRNATHYVRVRYVKYILVTANNWKQPIKNFNLIVEEPSLQDNPEGWRISICFEKELTKISNNRFESTIKNYIPKKDIAVYLFYR